MYTNFYCCCLRKLKIILYRCNYFYLKTSSKKNKKTSLSFPICFLHYVLNQRIQKKGPEEFYATNKTKRKTTNHKFKHLFGCCIMIWIHLDIILWRLSKTLLSFSHHHHTHEKLNEVIRTYLFFFNVKKSLIWFLTF